MASARATLAAILALGCLAAGCTNLQTTRAIDSFAEGLAAADADQLREATSGRFAHQALRLPDAVDDLQVLRLPTGERSVVEVVEISDDKRHVTVEYGEKDRPETIEYQLVRDDEHRNWVVDDVFVTQDTRASGMVTKSVTEQMDLLLSVREMISAWENGTREEVLESAAPELRAVLGELPPAFLQQVTREVVAGRGRSTGRPEARMNGEDAVVMLPRDRGQLIARMKLDESKLWRVQDLAVEERGDVPVASALRTATALHATAEFFKAYSAADHERLAKIATPEFYKNSLIAADLSQVPVPTMRLMSSQYEYRPHGAQVDVVLPLGDTSYVVSLTGPEPGATALPAEKAEYAVSEVSVYENGSGEVKRMSALFTAQAVVDVFAEALVQRDRTRLIALSTADFSERAWSAVDDVVLRALPLSEVDTVPDRVVATVFNGPSAEVTVTQGNNAVTYVLRSNRGRMRVDDVMLPVANRPSSLKATIEVLAPIYGFALGLHRDDLQLLRTHSASGLNRMVWAHVDHVPDIGFRLDDHMVMPIRSIRVAGGHSIVDLADGRRTTRITLEQQGSRYLIQDVTLSVGDGPSQQADLMQALRQEIAGGARFAERSPERRSDIIPASGESF